MFLKEISDDLLIKLRREGNQDAIDLLLERYRKFIYGIINDFFKTQNEYHDYDEYYQESICISDIKELHTPQKHLKSLLCQPSEV